MTEVLLIGGSIPALAAALDLAKVGITVYVGEAPVRVPRLAVTDADGAVAEFLAEVAQPITPDRPEEGGAKPVREEPKPSYLRSKDGKWQPQPLPALLGIPTVPLSEQSLAILGSKAAFRAYLDRVKPVLTLGKEEDFEALVSSRIGAAACSLLVDPFVFERYGVASRDAEASVIAPGLNEALTRAGSLTGGVALLDERTVARETRIAPAAGWDAFAHSLHERLFLYGAVKLESAVVSIDRVGDDELGGGGDEWIVTDESGETRSVKAIIADDYASLPESAALRGELEAISPGKLRAYAQFGILEPVVVSSAQADALGSGWGALRTVPDAAGNTWSVRLVPPAMSGDDEGWIAICGSPAGDRAAAESFARAAETLPAAVDLKASGEVSTWIEAAPYATSSDRDSNQNRLHAWSLDRPDVLVGDEAHDGGDLGAALARVREQAVRLGRRLVGIAD